MPTRTTPTAAPQGARRGPLLLAFGVLLALALLFVPGGFARAEGGRAASATQAPVDSPEPLIASQPTPEVPEPTACVPGDEVSGRDGLFFRAAARNRDLAQKNEALRQQSEAQRVEIERLTAELEAQRQQNVGLERSVSAAEAARAELRAVRRALSDVEGLVLRMNPSNVMAYRQQVLDRIKAAD